MPSQLTKEQMQKLDPYLIPWLEFPVNGAIQTLGFARVSAARHSYEYDGQTITIDISGPPIKRSQCVENGFPFCFEENESVLLADNPRSTMPIHIEFSPGIKAVGASVAAECTDLPAGGLDYHAKIAIKLDGDTQKFPLECPATLRTSLATAPFVGMQVENGSLITDVYFDALADSFLPEIEDFVRVAIGDLRCVW